MQQGGRLQLINSGYWGMGLKQGEKYDLRFYIRSSDYKGRITARLSDKAGHEFGGGTIIYGPDEDNYGIGHSSAYEWEGRCYFIAHAYDRNKNGASILFIRPLMFDEDGWIIPED